VTSSITLSRTHHGHAAGRSAAAVGIGRSIVRQSRSACGQILIRHGESVLNLEGRVQGQEDVELSALGIRQAEAMAAWGRTIAARESIEEIWASPSAAPAQRPQRSRPPSTCRCGSTTSCGELHAGIFQGHLWADPGGAAFPRQRPLAERRRELSHSRR